MNMGINKIIKVLILADIALVGGFGFVAPIFAIYVTDQIEGGNIEMIGYAAAIFLIVKSIFVIPFGRYLDKNHGEKDDVWFIIISTILASAVVFGYIFSRFAWHIYCLQVLYGIAMAMNVPAYTAVFTRHIDKGKEAFDWSVRSCLLGIGAGIAGALGGLIANRFGFNVLFFGVGSLILLGALFPLLIRKEISLSDKRALRIPEVKTGGSPELKK